jgi:predicted lactoylglutathione lyase
MLSTIRTTEASLEFTQATVDETITAGLLKSWTTCDKDGHILAVMWADPLFMYQMGNEL